jgi:hypothetical protein
MNHKVPAPVWFTVMAVVALLWNLLGVMVYLWMTWLMEKIMTPEALQALPDAERAAMEAQLAMQAVTPAWATAAFAFAVFGGLLGSVFLLLKKNLAIPFLTISLAALLVQSYYAYVVAGAFAIYGIPAVIQSLVILSIAIVLLWLANKAKANGWST